MLFVNGLSFIKCSNEESDLLTLRVIRFTVEPQRQLPMLRLTHTSLYRPAGRVSTLFLKICKSVIKQAEAQGLAP